MPKKASPCNLVIKTAKFTIMYPRPQQHLILIGMMGSGKTSVGRLLAHAHKLSFLDTDHEIERETGCSIPILFKNQGEEAFREIEAQVLKRIVQRPEPTVISTGGGTIITPANRDLLWDKGFVVYLKADPETLLQRVARDSHRPLLQEGDPLQTLTRLLEARAPFYEHAHLTLQVDRINCRMIAGRIWSHYSKRR
jgi:shikimate kinase